MDPVPRGLPSASSLRCRDAGRHVWTATADAARDTKRRHHVVGCMYVANNESRLDEEEEKAYGHRPSGFPTNTCTCKVRGIGSDRQDTQLEDMLQRAVGE